MWLSLFLSDLVTKRVGDRKASRSTRRLVFILHSNIRLGKGCFNSFVIVK